MGNQHPCWITIDDASLLHSQGCADNKSFDCKCPFILQLATSDTTNVVLVPPPLCFCAGAVDRDWKVYLQMPGRLELSMVCFNFSREYHISILGLEIYGSGNLGI